MTIKDLEQKYMTSDRTDGPAFIKSIRAVKNDSGVAKLSLLGFLDRLISDFLPEGRRICKAAPNLSSQDKRILTFQGKVICAAILVSQETRTVENLRRLTLLFLEYASVLVKTKYDFVKVAVDTLSYPITSTGIDWKTIQDELSLDIISYKLTTGIVFDRSRPDYFQFTGKGKIICANGVLSVASAEVGETGATAFTLFDESVKVVTRNSRDEKLKSSAQRDIEALASFAMSFIRSQEAFVKGKPKKREYSTGDRVNIRFTYASELECEILDPDNPMPGRVINEELIKGTWTEDIKAFLFDGDVIEGAEMVIDEDGTWYSIQKAYEAFAKEAARKSDMESSVFEAKVTRVCSDIGRINWMTPFGYGGISYPIEGKDLAVGDTCVMSINNIQTGNGSVYINLRPPKYGYDTVDAFFDNDEDVLIKFVTSEDEVETASETIVEGEDEKDASTVRILASIIANRAFSEPSIEHYEALLSSIFLRTVIGDAEGVARLKPEAYYLRMLISFAQGGHVVPVPPYEFDADRSELLRILSSAGNENVSLRKELVLPHANALARKVGSLLLGLEISTAFPDQVKAEQEDVRRRICGLLDVSDEYRAIPKKKSGKYGRSETNEVEFKSSYVYRNDDKGPDLDYQGRGQVFEAVCGFLNSDNGGTVYIGVDNNGDPILDENRGLNADIQWFCANYRTVNSIRREKLGRDIIKADNKDHYVLFLNGEKELYFKESLLENITIEVTEDDDAIRIRVRPAEYEIAYLYSDKEHKDGVAHVRDGGRTIPMSPTGKVRRLATLKKISKEVGFVVTIQEAIDKHRKLIFKDYASGNSGKVTDRFVVPVNLFYNDENVFCYDLVAKKYKQFRLKRISSIEELAEFYPLPAYIPEKADVFRWLIEGRKQYHIKFRMDIAAKNYLLEEYSCAEKLIGTELYEETREKWILDTMVNGLLPARRFYLGLADKIEILDTEDSEALKKDIAEYVATNILAK